jgi:hypothetical protein
LLLLLHLLHLLHLLLLIVSLPRLLLLLLLHSTGAERCAYVMRCASIRLLVVGSCLQG